jgi:spore maturation protein CgeB
VRSLRPLRRAPRERLDIVVLGLSITSSWGNGHATTFRGLVRELAARGHGVLFLERDQPWYARHRDLPRPPWGRTRLYGSLRELRERYARAVRAADLVMVGSYVPEGVAVGEWVTGVANGVTSFYDIDTPVTLARLERGDGDYISRELIPRYDLYLSFTGGPILERIERRYGAPAAAALYCACDPELYRPAEVPVRWSLGYLGTYSPDRQPVLRRLMLQPARRRPALRFVVAGPLYPVRTAWPLNVERIEHLAPSQHAAFYNAQRFTLNVTRADMVQAGYSPSVRLFEAAACGTAIVTDPWPGLSVFFAPGREILVARAGADTLRWLERLPEEERRAIGARARARVLAEHTSAHRAAELEQHALEARERKAAARARGRLALAGVTPAADPGVAS